MHHFVRSKQSPYHLYKKSGHLVRTPITVTLQPSEMAYYSVAGTWTSTSWPNTGFIEQNTVQNVYGVGYDCLQALFNHGDSRQRWRQATSSHLPETVWYQGAFATSAPTIAATYQSCEAYMQMGAYKFKLPDGLSGLKAGSAKVKYVNGGAIVCYQSAGSGSSNNVLWKNSGTVQSSTFYMRFAVGGDLGHIQTIAAYPFDYVDLALQTGTPRGVRDLWGFTGTTRDGGIPTFTTETTNQFDMSSQTLAALNSGLETGVWVVPYIGAAVTSSTNYQPMYVNAQQNGYWACGSAWGLSLVLELDD